MQAGKRPSLEGWWLLQSYLGLGGIVVANILIVVEVAEYERHFLRHIRLHDGEQDRLPDSHRRADPNFFRVEVGRAVARNVEDTVNEARDVRRALLGDDAAKMTTNGRPEEPKVCDDVLQTKTHIDTDCKNSLEEDSNTEPDNLTHVGHSKVTRQNMIAWMILIWLQLFSEQI